MGKYLDRWRDQGNESTDAALRRLSNNVDAGEVSVKVSALNGLYATSIYGVVQMARHIVGLNIDERLSSGQADSALIEQIAHLTQTGKVRRNYSFARKYCSFHRPDVYPIYDSLVVRVLNGLLKQVEVFDRCERGETWNGDYDVYCRSIAGFRHHFGLEQFSFRDIDKYLWMVAKEHQTAAT